MDDLSVLLDNIRKQVIIEAEQEFADGAFQHLRCSVRNQRMQDADAVSCVAGECGCAMEIYLKFRNGHVEEASYVTDGDADVRLCGSCVANLAVGKDCRELLSLKPVDVLQRLGRHGIENEKCALLALAALQKAVEQHSLRSSGVNGQKRKLSRPVRYISTGRSFAHLQYTN